MASTKLRPGSPLMRWAPTLAVILAPIGCAITMAGSATGNEILTWSVLLPSMCTIVVSSLFLAQPRPLNGTPGQPLDEREIVQRLTANVRALGLVATIAMLGICYMYFATDVGWWMPSGKDDWGSLLSTFACWSFGMPLAFANWQTLPPLDDEDEVQP